MTNSNVVTGKIRFSYLDVFKPRADKDGSDSKYGACLLIPKSDTATHQKIMAACEAARLESAKVFGGKVPGKLKLPIYDGDEDKPNGGEYGKECKGHWVINARSKYKPGVVDRNREEIFDATEFYSGCYGRASISFYAYNFNGNKGIAAGLNHVQKLEDGAPLGGRMRVEDAFADDYEDDFLD
jgi:hypothetical protein